MLICLIVSILLATSYAQPPYDNVEFKTANKRLYIDLFESYYSHQSPYNTGNTGSAYPPAEVQITLRYSHLTHVIEVQMTHTHVFGMELTWRDPRLTWDQTKYSNIKYIYVRTSDLWMPELTACESSSFSLITPELGQKATLNSTGHIQMILIGYASFICDFSVQDFPFDKHWCFYCFALPGYTESELVFVGQNASWQTVMGSSEWEMNPGGSRHMYSKLRRKEFPTLIYFDFLISRRPTFWVLLIIIPAFLLGFLILLGLFFGKERNNLNSSVNLGLIAFTSMTFIIGILADSLPKSMHISVLGWYILCELCIITLAVLSVSLHGALSAAASAGYTWWTGENEIVPVFNKTSDTTERKESRGVPRNRWLLFCVEKVVNRGVLNFGLFLALHVANLAWLLAYAFMPPPELPADYFAPD